MSKYLFIESRDPFEFADAVQTWRLAVELGEAGHDVAYFLVQNGVLAARAGAKVETLTGTGKVKVYVDDVSLAERAMSGAKLKDGVTVAGSDELVDLTLEEGRRPIWT